MKLCSEENKKKSLNHVNEVTKESILRAWNN